VRVYGKETFLNKQKRTKKITHCGKNVDVPPVTENGGSGARAEKRKKHFRERQVQSRNERSAE